MLDSFPIVEELRPGLHASLPGISCTPEQCPRYKAVWQLVETAAELRTCARSDSICPRAGPLPRNGAQGFETRDFG